MADKIIVGIDVSMNSTGITVINGDKTNYISFFNIRNLTKAKKYDAQKVLEADGYVSQFIKIENFKMFLYDRMPGSASSSALNTWHRSHINFCTNVTQDMAYQLRNIINDTGKELVINIEYYSMGSTSSSATIQIAEFTGILKSTLLKEDVVTPNNIYVTPGPTLKKFAGGGNYDKYDLLVEYINRTVADTSDQFAVHVGGNLENLYKTKITGKGSNVKKEVPSPLNDVIDSWWAAQYIKKNL